MRPSTSHHTFTWRDITCRVTMRHNYRVEGWTLLIIDVVHPAEAPIPFAVDGYRQHGLEQDAIDAAGGLQPFLAAWAERESHTPAYAIALAKWKQHDLFQ